jgi:stearoyl-CoA desaturase (delta-9 desaturase)
MKLKDINTHVWYVSIPFYLLFIYSLTQLGQYNIFYFIGFLITWILVGGVGVELGLHRFFSHGCFVFNKLTTRTVGLLGSLALNGSPIFWAAVHSGYHHRYADKEKDIHSPIHGFFRSYIGWTIDKRVTDEINLAYAGRRSLDDSFIRFLQKYYSVCVLTVFLAVFLISNSFFILSFIPAVFLSYHQGLLVNVLGHDNRLGYVNYELDNNSRNIKWLSYLTFGLALHNNHHKFPHRTNFAVKEGEFDLGYKLSKFLRFKETHS